VPAIPHLDSWDSANLTKFGTQRCKGSHIVRLSSPKLVINRDELTIFLASIGTASQLAILFLDHKRYVHVPFAEVCEHRRHTEVASALVQRGIQDTITESSSMSMSCARVEQKCTVWGMLSTGEIQRILYRVSASWLSCVQCRGRKRS
jgi:hypothetical protein